LSFIVKRPIESLMFMSLFFFIPTALLFGLCHWVARQAKPGDTDSIETEFLLHWTVSETGQAIEAWLKKRPQIKILDQQPGRISVEQASTFFSFGAFYHFHWDAKSEKEDEISVVRAVIQPKLLHTTTERTSFASQLKKSLDSMLIQNSDENVDFSFKSY